MGYGKCGLCSGNKESAGSRIVNDFRPYPQEIVDMKGKSFPNKKRRKEGMKIVNHKNGNRSFVYSPAEQVHGSYERIKAITNQAVCSGGVPAMLADLLVFNQKELTAYITSTGTEALQVMMEICLNAEKTPYGKGCMEAVLNKCKPRVTVGPL
jgi:hypothetical protein